MAIKRIATLIIACAVVLVLGIQPLYAGPAQALSSGQAAAGLTIPYPGRLASRNGQAVADGGYDFIFSLYAAETGGEPLWSETQSGLPVQGGAFTAMLGRVNPIPASVLESGRGWLELALRAPGEAQYTTLAPRQVVSATALSPSGTAAAGACPHNHFGEMWSGTTGGVAGLGIVNNAIGLYARSSLSDGVEAEAIAANKSAVFAHSENGFGISARSGSNYAVSAYSASGNAVRAESLGGLGIETRSISNTAILASSTVGDGIEAIATAPNKSGVFAHSDQGYGISARSGSNYAISAYSANGIGIEGNSNGNFGLRAQGNEAGGINDRLGDLLLAGERGEIFSFGKSLDLYSDINVDIHLDDNNNDPNAALWILDGQNNIIGGFQENGTKTAVVRTQDYGQRAVYAMESPEVWLEDFGNATLADGSASIPIEPVFAQTANLKEDYHVFLTPVCQQPVLLFVTTKTPEGFSVQGVSLDGQPSNCAFDYRLVAKRLGLEDLRLQVVPAP